MISYDFPPLEDRQRLVKEFYRFLRGRLSQTHSTAETHMYLVGKFLREVEGSINAETISDYLLRIENSSTQSNYLKALKDFVGVVDSSTLSDYVKTDWKDYRDRILGKTE